MILLFWRADNDDGPLVNTSYYDDYTGGRNPEGSSSYTATGVGYTTTLTTPRVSYDPSEDT